MKSLFTNNLRYKELMKNPLLFLHLVDHSYNDSVGNYVEIKTWEPLDKDFQGSIQGKEIDGNNLGFALVVAGQTTKNDNDAESQNERIEFLVSSVDPLNLNDWCLVFNSFIIRAKILTDKYPYIHLLWMLNYCWWNSQIINKVINNYNIQTQSFLINNALCKICRCLSIDKQEQMKIALKQYNINYIIYSYNTIKDAFNCLTQLPNISLNTLNLFDKVDILLEDDYRHPVNRKIEEGASNPILSLYRWLHKNEASIDYNFLNPLFSISSHKIQLEIVKRYYHDLRLGRTSIDIQLIEQFKDSRYTEFIRYRYCLFTPDERINLSVPLLCDCILTLYKSGGKTFQSYNGILDFAMTHCDVSKPNITLGMEEFLPLCNGGAVYNAEFKGFIDYNIVCELDESKFTEENLLSTIREELDKYPHHKYYACSYDEKHEELSEEMKRHCLSEYNNVDSQSEKKGKRFSCFIQYPYKNKWSVLDSDYKRLKHFLKSPLPSVENNQTIIIDLEQTSTIKAEEYIRSLVEKCEKTESGRFIIRSSDIKILSNLIKYSKPITMRIFPQSQPIIGMQFDLFGLLDSIVNDNKDEKEREFREKESAEIKKHVIETLMSELGPNDFNGDYFELPYDRELLGRIIGLYYYKGVIPDRPIEKQIQFLKRQNQNNYSFFCAPEIAKEHNKATDLPFFWCRGLECFQNSLNKQTLEKCSVWQEYSLYHLIEIMGFIKIQNTEAGYEPDKAIKEFISCANRVMKIFRRLRCRNCGHLLYTYQGNGFNRYNHYSCINPTCPEYNNPVYLNYCFKCKKGLIDSRDSARCPNGWYICPTCHSCCDDEQYERQAQRYIVENRPVPLSIKSKRGQGHNDKRIYFCHKCGTQLQFYSDNGEHKWWCPHCEEKYNI